MCDSLDCKQGARKRLQTDFWQVEVTIGGQSVLVIGDSHLSGIENISDYDDVIEKCGLHLLSFVGKGL